MNCPGRYKYRNVRENRMVEFECAVKNRCKRYTFRTQKQGKVMVSKTAECSEYDELFKGA